MKKCILGICLLFSVQAFALNWTDQSQVSYVRTYDGTTYSIGLVGERCPNEKSYYYVSDRDNNDTFYSIALAALMSGKNVRISYVQDDNGVHCRVDGIWIVS